MRFLFIFIFLYSTGLSAQTDRQLTAMTFFAAHNYDSYQGEARIAQVRQLEWNSWMAIDSFYERDWTSREEKQILHTSKSDLSPFIDEDGEVEYLVADVAPQFPGGRLALEQHLKDAIRSYAGRNESVQHSVYLRCTIDKNGSIINITPVQPLDNIPEALAQECLDAVHYMPAWSPAIHKGKTVRACVMINIGLKE